MYYWRVSCSWEKYDASLMMVSEAWPVTRDSAAWHPVTSSGSLHAQCDERSGNQLVCRQHQHVTLPSIVSVIVLWMATWHQPIALSCSVLKLLLFMCCVFHESNMFIHPSHFIIVLQNRHSNVFNSLSSTSFDSTQFKLQKNRIAMVYGN